jgi:hypothetical protein
MKKLAIFLSALLLSCNSEYNIIDTKIVKGRVSAIEEGYKGRVAQLPKIYVQDRKQTITIDIPFANEHDYKIGDSITVIIQQVEHKKK